MKHLNILKETPNYNKNDFESLTTDIWIGTNRGSHSDIRIKFMDNNVLIPLRMDSTGVKLDNKYTVSKLKMSAKIFYQTCDWFICNRDIINTYFQSNLDIRDASKLLNYFLEKRDKEIIKNKNAYMLPYYKTEQGCKFNIQQQIPINVDMKNITTKIEQEQVDEAIKPLLQNAGLL